MTYFSAGMTRAEVRRTYHYHAKTMHPDVGGDEEAFKEMTDEYARLMRQFASTTTETAQSMMDAVHKRASLILEVLRDAYPRTVFTVSYTYDSVTVTFDNNTPFGKMMDIERIAKELDSIDRLIILFKRGDSKKRYTFSTLGSEVYINMSESIRPDMSTATMLHRGPRYTVLWTRTHDCAIDAKENRTYCMRRTPKFELKELLGIGR